jgi:hypothetical protein
MRVERGVDWRPTKWNADKHLPGTVIGFSDEDGTLVGTNTNAQYWDRFYLDQRNKVTVGPAWCAVRWDATKTELIYPIGARGPLGKWWTGTELEVSYGDKCFALNSSYTNA